MRRPFALAAAIALAASPCSGCATVRWVDGATEGDLFGTAGTEIGALELLRDTPGDGRTAPVDGPGPSGPAVDGALDVLLDVFLTTLALW